MRRVVLAALIIIAFLSAAGGAATYKPRLVVLNGVTGLGLARLLDDSDYEVEVGKSADVGVARLNTMGADAAALPVSTAALLRNKGTDIRLAAITNYGSLYIVSSKAGADLLSTATSFLGVPGKGTMPDVILDILLSLKKVKGSGIQYYSSPVELANLLAAGRIESALLPEPWVSQALSANKELRIAYDLQGGWKSAYGADYPLSCVVATESFIRDHPAEYAKLLADIEQSVIWVTENPGEAALIAEGRLAMPKASTEAAIPRCNFKYLDGADARLSALSFYERAIVSSAALIGGKLPDEAFYKGR